MPLQAFSSVRCRVALGCLGDVELVAGNAYGAVYLLLAVGIVAAGQIRLEDDDQVLRSDFTE